MGSLVISSKFNAGLLKSYVLENIKRSGIEVSDVQETGERVVRITTPSLHPSAQRGFSQFKTYMVAAFGNEVSIYEA